MSEWHAWSPKWKNVSRTANSYYCNTLVLSFFLPLHGFRLPFQPCTNNEYQVSTSIPWNKDYLEQLLYFLSLSTWFQLSPLFCYVCKCSSPMQTYHHPLYYQHHHSSECNNNRNSWALWLEKDERVLHVLRDAKNHLDLLLKFTDESTRKVFFTWKEKT